MEKEKKRVVWLNLLVILILLSSVVFAIAVPPASAAGVTAVNGQITMVVPPLANFTASPTTGVAPLTVNFTDTSSGLPTSWSWDFNNDGTIDSTVQNASYTYTWPGNYTVKLTVTNPAGSNDEIKSAYIKVYAVPVAAFSGTPTTSNTGRLMVNFQDQSTGNVISWAWDFTNDGIFDSTAQNPSYTYTAAGNYTVKLTVTNPAGTDDEIKIDYIKIGVIPVASFTPSATTLTTPPYTVSFTDTSTGSPASWLWDFGDPLSGASNASTLQNPGHTYTAAGTYTVKLTVTNPAGTDDEIKIDYIKIGVIPVASFTPSATTLTTPPYTVNFTDTSTGPPASWLWDFGDPLSGASNASTLQNPGHTFSKPGRYAVKLTASNPGGSNTVAQTINVYGAPVPGFTLSHSPANRTISGGKVTTTLNASASRGPVDRYVINWGDGSAETVVDYPAVASGTHDYTTAGTYAITLKVITPHTPEGVTSAPAIVNIYPSSQVNIQLRGSGDTDYLVLQPGGDVTGNIEVWAKNIPDAGADSGMGAYDIRIDFDKTKVQINSVSGGQAPFNGTPQNNAPPEEVNANATGQLFINAYQTGSDPKGSFKLAVINLTALTPGIHNLVLTINNVTMVNGNPLNVSPVSGTVVVQQSPTADFTAEPTILTTSPYTVNFRDASTGQPNSFSWDFGDPASGPGNTSNLQHPSHTFSGPGLYNISLTVNNLSGPANTAIKNNYVKIYAAPVANFTASLTSGVAPLTVNFTDVSTGNIMSWAWDFGDPPSGDANTSTDKNPIHTYGTAGQYTVTLTVTNPAGTNSLVKTNYITVYAAPVANFSGTPTTGTTGSLTVNFTDGSSGPPTSWAWDFKNDGTATSTAQNPNYTYTAPGNYTVKLTVTNPAGTNNVTRTNYITVYAAPIASFTSPALGYAGAPVSFADTSSGNVESWLWDFRRWQHQHAAEPQTCLRRRGHLYRRSHGDQSCRQQ